MFTFIVLEKENVSMNLNQLFSFFIQFASSVGAISKEDATKAEKALDTLFPETENDPTAGEDKVTLSQTAEESFNKTAGDDGKLELDELKKRAEDYLSKYATQEEKEKYGPMMGIFLDDNNKVDEELYKQLAGDKNYLTAEDIKKLDANGDGRVTKDEVASYKKSLSPNDAVTKGPNDGTTTDETGNVAGNTPPSDVEETTPSTPSNSKPSIEETVQNALNDESVVSLREQVDKAQEQVEKLSTAMQQNETVAAAIKSLNNFNALIGQLASATDPNEVNNLLTQIKNQAATIASAQKAISQAVQDEAKQIYNDPIATDINSLLGDLPVKYQNYYTDGEIPWLSTSYTTADKSKNEAVANFKNEATDILEAVSAELRKELKAQLGDKYNAAEVDAYIKTAMDTTINNYVNNATVVGKDGKDEYTQARGKHSMVFEIKSRDKGRWTYDPKSLMDDFMSNYKAAVNNTPTQQLTDTKSGAKDKYAEFQEQSQAVQTFQRGGRLFDENGNIMNMSLTDYMSDYNKQQTEEFTKQYQEKANQLNELMNKMTNSMSQSEAESLETQMNQLYKDLDSIAANLKRIAQEAYYSYMSKNQGNNGYNISSSTSAPDFTRFD